LRNWLDNLGGPAADRQIIASYMQQDNYTAALSLANIQTQLYKLNEIEIEANNDLIEIITLCQTLFVSNRRFETLDENEMGVLKNIAARQPSEARALARGILNAYYDITYDDCFDMPTTTSYKKGQANADIWAKIYGLEIEVNPNPARSWASFDFKLPETGTSALLEITDLSGSKVLSVKLNGLQGQYMLDTRDIANGMYLYTFTCGKAAKTGKLVISK
ncbi:MAG: T9SS type A sorting domain-containing protein, partial [Bacteroidota bacterium]